MKDNPMYNESLKKTEESSFHQAIEILENSPRYSYPQYAHVSEEEFLEDIGLVRSENLDIKTSLKELNFAIPGEAPVLITLFDHDTKQYNIRALNVSIFPSKKKYALLKNAYWRTYGLVLEGQLSYTDVRSYKVSNIYTLELITPHDKVAGRYSVRIGKRGHSQPDKFHVVLEKKAMVQLEEGVYRFQIRAGEGNSGHTHVSRIIEKENLSFFSAYPVGYSFVSQVEEKDIEDKHIQLNTNLTGELFLEVTK